MRCGPGIACMCAALLAGCASQADRENLRNCRWEIAGIRMDTAGKGYAGIATLHVTNPTRAAAVLDSLWLDVSTPGGALARLSHGRTLVLPAGKSDTVRVRFSANPADLGARLMEMLFAAPDSLSIRGQARVPLLWGAVHTTRDFRVRVPAAPFLGSVSKMMMPGGPARKPSAPSAPAPSDTLDDP